MSISEGNASFSLSTGARTTLTALAPIICTDEVRELGLEGAVVDHMQLMLGTFPPHMRIAFLVGAFVFEWLAVFFPSSRLRRFSQLPRTEQVRYFERWWRSPFFAIRQAAKGLKSLIALGYWEQRQVLERLEYHPERWIAEVAARRLRDYAADIRAHDALVLEPHPLPERLPRPPANGVQPAQANVTSPEPLIPAARVQQRSHGQA
jgi:hypothetical protein